jgi:hypothetical protein
VLSAGIETPTRVAGVVFRFVACAQATIPLVSFLSAPEATLTDSRRLQP